MIEVRPVTLALNGVRLEPLALSHADGLRAAVVDGELWKLWVTSAPEPQDVEQYIGAALDGSVRDTVMYSILRAEWPQVEAQLQRKLEAGFSRA